MYTEAVLLQVLVLTYTPQLVTSFMLIKVFSVLSMLNKLPPGVCFFLFCFFFWGGGGGGGQQAC